MADPGLIVDPASQIIGANNAIAFSDARAAPLRHLLGDSSAPTVAPIAVLVPDSVEQVQRLIELARTVGFALVTVPNAAGNGAGLVGGNKPAAVLDLSRMDEIIEFNADSGYALVEPGVSFDQLRAHIGSLGSSHWVDCDENGANSISGSINERAFGYTPYGDHLLMQCGMEVVTANGEVMRTGMGALPDSDTWQLFKYNYGPYLDGLFTRSDFAVVTKVGVWLMPAPPAYHPFMVTLPEVAALEQAIEVMRALKIGMVVPNTVMISHRSADAELLRVSDAAGLVSADSGEWTLYGALYGLSENVQITWEMVAGALASIPNAKISTISEPPQDAAWSLRTRLMHGEPVYSKTAEQVDRKLRFSASAPMEGSAATAMRDILQASLTQKNISFSYEYALTWRTMFMQVAIGYRTEDLAAYTEAALETIATLTAAGFAISHDSRELTTAVSAAHTGSSLQHLYRSLDTALDPDGILRGGWSS